MGQVDASTLVNRKPVCKDVILKCLTFAKDKARSDTLSHSGVASAADIWQTTKLASAKYRSQFQPISVQTVKYEVLDVQAGQISMQ